MQKMVGTDSAPSNYDGSVHSFILHVCGGVTVKIFFVCETDFGNVLSSCFDVSDIVLLL